MKDIIIRLVKITSRRWSALHSAKAGLRAKTGLMRRLFRAASGAATLTAKKEMTRRVKVSVKAEINWVKKTSQKSSRSRPGKSR